MGAEYARLRLLTVVSMIPGLAQAGEPAPVAAVRAAAPARAAPPGATPAATLDARAVFAATQRDASDGVTTVAARRWHLDPFLLKGLLVVESRLRPGAVNHRTGALGIAQFTRAGRAAVRQLRRRRGVPPARAVFGRAGALDPRRAIPAAAELLAHLIGRYGRDGGVTAYNTGPRGGALVRRHGYWRARRHVGCFLLLVLRETNRLRTAAGLAPLRPPEAPRRPPRPRRDAGNS